MRSRGNHMVQRAVALPHHTLLLENLRQVLCGMFSRRQDWTSLLVNLTGLSLNDSTHNTTKLAAKGHIPVARQAFERHQLSGPILTMKGTVVTGPTHIMALTLADITVRVRS